MFRNVRANAISAFSAMYEEVSVLLERQHQCDRKYE